MEPDFIAQTAEPMLAGERRQWVVERCRESRAKGITFHRLSCHPQNRDLLLLEGWKVQPEDQGEPRFQFAASQ